jgi:hypothetical protein
MFLEVYYEYSEPCGPRSNVFLDVKGCLKFLGAVFRGVFAWEKSMLSASCVLSVVKPDWRVLDFNVVDGVKSLE